MGITIIPVCVCVVRVQVPDTTTNRLTWNDTGTLPRQHGYVTKTTGCNYDNTYLIPQKKQTWLTHTCYQDKKHTKTTWHAAKHTSQEERFQMTPANRSFTYTGIEKYNYTCSYKCKGKGKHTDTHVCMCCVGVFVCVCVYICGVCLRVEQ